MKKTITVLALTLTLALLGWPLPRAVEASAGSRVRRVTIKASCRYPGRHMGRRTVLAFGSSGEAIAVVDRIMKHTGLKRYFEVEAADVENAEAGVDGNNKPYIWYNKDFMNQITRATRTDWARISIIAHEIAHLLMWHTFAETPVRHDLELQADKYSGHILRRMGASLPEAQAAVRAYADAHGTSSHPPRHLRLAAIIEGWREADAQLRGLPGATNGRPAPPPAPRPTPPPASQGNRQVFRLTAGNTASPLAENLWQWTVFVEAPEEALSLISCVEYTLHPTFRPNVFRVCERGARRAFALNGKGDGTFKVRIRVLTKDNRQYLLSHDLRFR